MLANSTHELLTMAKAIGVDSRWLQMAGTPNEHMDICKSKQLRAIELGAELVETRFLAHIVRVRRMRAGRNKNDRSLEVR